ncbi:MAG: hypothetical protein BGO98_33800 [Myxococcales bacterium 68-20]|nr:MAG: hypothetical protein BGO98_33800 [Myxococcales bacterium 68-20]
MKNDPSVRRRGPPSSTSTPLGASDVASIALTPSVTAPPSAVTVTVDAPQASGGMHVRADDARRDGRREPGDGRSELSHLQNVDTARAYTPRGYRDT